MHNVLIRLPVCLPACLSVFVCVCVWVCVGNPKNKRLVVSPFLLLFLPGVVGGQECWHQRRPLLNLVMDLWAFMGAQTGTGDTCVVSSPNSSLLRDTCVVFLTVMLLAFCWFGV